MNITDVMTIKEASEKYGIKVDRIRVYLHRGAKGWIENIDYKKSSGTWLITKAAMEKRFNSFC